MDFARKILSNYGWKEGDGLGKNKHGIAKPLKATLKFDNAGFGADQAAADFNNHWWERVFNEAATNVNIKQEGEEIKMALKDEEDGVEISTKSYSTKKLKKLKNQRGDQAGNEIKNAYENFLQAAILTNQGDEIENPDKIDANDIEVTKVKILTDEELFKACGGRTAHKGARHGLKLSGKLSRIEQQEAELLAKMMAKRNGLTQKESTISNTLESKSVVAEDNPGEEEKQCTKQRKKKNKHKTKDKETQDVQNDIDQNESIRISKKKKRKLKDTESIEENSGENEEIPVGNEKINKKKKKKKAVEKNKEAIECQESTEEQLNSSNEAVNNDEVRPIKKKKKKSDENCEEEIVHKKKKKKNKNKDEE
ncbi:uncharacterized protein ACRADG_008787 [Cochliomyia hominivorax]